MAYAEKLTPIISYKRKGRSEATKKIQDEINLITGWGKR